VKGFWSSSQHFGEALTGLSPYASEFQRAVEVGFVSFETAGPFEVLVLVLLSLCPQVSVMLNAGNYYRKRLFRPPTSITS
jgi:hypothetical protein